MSTGPPPPASRKDAVRNRAALVEAAARSFSTGGLRVSVNTIAREAGVNVATLYRHFPTKDHLVDAVLETLLEPLTEARDAALRSGDVVATFLHRAVGASAETGGVGDMLRDQPTGSAVRERLRGLAVDIASPVAERAHADGTLRADRDALDLLVALQMVASTSAAADVGRDVGRYVDVVVRGLRPAGD